MQPQQCLSAWDSLHLIHGHARQDLLILHVYVHVGMSILVHSFVQANDLHR